METSRQIVAPIKKRTLDGEPHRLRFTPQYSIVE
jgi:hypothetical protein